MLTEYYLNLCFFSEKIGNLVSTVFEKTGPSPACDIFFAVAKIFPKNALNLQNSIVFFLTKNFPISP